MKASEYEAMKPEELEAKIAELKTELFNLLFLLSTVQLVNTMQISTINCEIAGAMTGQRQAELKA